MIAHLSEIKPQVATALGGIQLAAGIGVWADSIQGIAALITVCLSVPTAILALIYWSYKVSAEIKKNKEEYLEDE